MPTKDLFELDSSAVWNTELAFQQLQACGAAGTKRTAERRLQAMQILPAPLDSESLVDETGRKPIQAVINAAIDKAREARRLVLFAQLSLLPSGVQCLHLNDSRGGRTWSCLSASAVSAEQISDAFRRIQSHIGRPITIFPSGELVRYVQHLKVHSEIFLALAGYPPTLNSSFFACPAGSLPSGAASPHLNRLEAESIHIIREAIASSENPVMLYSIGKDSSVMMHLARKAFYPGPPPFPLMHIDTRWKFQEMYMFRDDMARKSGMDLLVHTNPDAIEKNINPFDHGSALHTDVTKTEGLKQALDHYKFDVIFGGARRDEEKSRAKERIFSFRSESHRWDPKNQRPELWNLYNTRKRNGESIRVFPLSNWTELDIWQYILQESIPVVPLYFAKERPVVVRNGMIIMVDDDRLKLLPGECIEFRTVRFRTLGCYPLTGAIESNAQNLQDIILELVQARNSERQGRAIDKDSSVSMEKKKQEGYF